MTRLRAETPDDIQFRATDSPPTRIQKLEFLRRWLVENLLGGTGVAWGAITGLIADQTDLIALFATKSDVGHIHDDRYYTEAEVDALIAIAVAGLFDIKGRIDCSGNPNYPAASKGDVYFVSVAGKIGGAAGISVDIADTLVCFADSAAGTQAAVGASWQIIEHNLIGALLAANALSELTAVAATARTNILAAPIYLPVTTQAGAYAFLLADAFSHVRFTSAVPVAATVPLNATVAFPIGTRIRITQAGAGVVTLTPETGAVTLNSRGAALASGGQFAVLEIEKVAVNEWDVLGDAA